MHTEALSSSSGSAYQERKTLGIAYLKNPSSHFGALYFAPCSDIKQPGQGYGSSKHAGGIGSMSPVPVSPVLYLLSMELLILLGFDWKRSHSKRMPYMNGRGAKRKAKSLAKICRRVSTKLRDPAIQGMQHYAVQRLNSRGDLPLEPFAASYDPSCPD
jgi:hypothetical protein